MRNPVLDHLPPATDGSKFVRVWLGVKRSTSAPSISHGSTDLRFAGERIGALGLRPARQLSSGGGGRKMHLLLLQ